MSEERADRRRRLLIFAQTVFAAAVAIYLAPVFAELWRTFRTTPLGISPRWGLLSLASLGVLSAYLLLVQVWRVMLRSWGEGAVASYGSVASIWFVSNLGRYIPGRVWALGTMAVMAERRSIAPAAMVSCAVFVTFINIVSGALVLVVFGPELVSPLLSGASWTPSPAVAGLLGAIALGMLWLAPVLLPRIVRWVTKLMGRPVESTVRMSRRSTFIALCGSAAAWLIYGVSFSAFVHAILPGLGGTLGQYIGVYTGSYLLGFVAFMFPSGIVVREAALITALMESHLASAPQAAVLALTSRLWLTILEIAPGLLILAVNAIAKRMPKGTMEARREL